MPRELELRYDAAPGAWHDGLPIGNGRVGAMLWDGRIDLNEDGFWSGDGSWKIPEGVEGVAAEAAELVRALGWNAEAIDLTGLGEGRYVAAPPTRVGGRGAVQWARRPTNVNRWLPDAAELISPLAYACAREAADARARVS